MRDTLPKAPEHDAPLGKRTVLRSDKGCGDVITNANIEKGRSMGGMEKDEEQDNASVPSPRIFILGIPSGRDDR